MKYRDARIREEPGTDNQENLLIVSFRLVIMAENTDIQGVVLCRQTQTTFEIFLASPGQWPNLVSPGRYIQVPGHDLR